MVAVESNLPQWLAELGRTQGQWDKALKDEAYTPIAAEGQAAARQFAVGTSPQAGHFAKYIRGQATTTRAYLTNSPVANAAIWGAKKHTGWYANKRYEKSAGRQFPAWVGDAWSPGGAGGPIGINDYLRHDDPTAKFVDAVYAVYGRAFPNKT